MYKVKESGLYVYETFDELIQNKITGAWDYDGKYYVTVESNNHYDNRIWVVDKKTLKVSRIYFTDFIIDYLDKAKQINPEMLKRVS